MCLDPILTFKLIYMFITVSSIYFYNVEIFSRRRLITNDTSYKTLLCQCQLQYCVIYNTFQRIMMMLLPSACFNSLIIIQHQLHQRRPETKSAKAHMVSSTLGFVQNYQVFQISFRPCNDLYAYWRQNKISDTRNLVDTKEYINKNKSNM